MARYLRRLGHVVGRKRVRRLLAKMGLEPICQRPRTTVPHPPGILAEHKLWPYLLRKLTIDRPDQVPAWPAGHAPFRNRMIRLLTDHGARTSPTSRCGAASSIWWRWATRPVLAWRLSNSMAVAFCLEALEEARSRRPWGPVLSPGDLRHRPRRGLLTASLPEVGSRTSWPLMEVSSPAPASPSC